MNRKAYVVSIDESLFQGAKDNLSTKGIADVVRIPGVSPVAAYLEVHDLIGHFMPEHALRNRYGDLIDDYDFYQELYRLEKVAIRQAMRKAVEVAAEDGGGLVMQEDIRFTERPTMEKPFIVYSGGVRHFCPKAFYVNREFALKLVRAWGNRSLNACDGWHHLVASFADVRDITVS